MHLAPPRRTGIGVNTPRKQRVVEANPVALDGDNAFALCAFEQDNRFRGGDAVGLCQQVHRRTGRTRRGQQHVADFVVEVAHLGAHKISQRTWQLLLDGR